MARKCPLCGSRKWRKDGVTGSVVCEDGHVLQGVRSETHVVGEPTGHALQRRRAARGPRENRRKLHGRADENFLHGEDAEYLRLQGLQLLLRHQVQALRRLWSLPDVYEAIVRDLWAYQLVVTPPLNTQGKKWKRPRAGPSSPGGSPGLGLDSEKEDEDGEKEDDGEKSDWDEKFDSDGTADGHESDVTDASDMTDAEGDDEELLRSASPDEHGSRPPSRAAGDPTAPEAWRRSRPLHVSDVLVCLILGLWVIRTPFTYKDIETVVNINGIPYIDFGKTTLVPEDMRAAMNVSVRISLCPQRSPSSFSLWRYTREFARILQLRFGQDFPEINVPPVAWGVISQLGGNATTHYQVLAFLELIDTNMGIMDTSIATYVRKRRNSDSQETLQQTTRYRDVHMPELSIAAGWVIVMKMAYGLDGQPRRPLVATDPLIGMPQGEMYLRELEQRVVSGIMRGEARDLDRQFFDTMEGDDIDRFLDGCEDVLLKDREHGTGFNAFPLPPVAKTDAPLPPPNSWSTFHDKAARNPVTQASAVPATTRNAELPLMPGDAIRSYGVDSLHALPHDLQVVLLAAGDVIGVDPVQIASVVELFERRMEAIRPRRAYSTNLQAYRLRDTLRESRSSSSLSAL